MSRPAHGPTQPPIQLTPGPLSSQVKLLWHDTNHSTLRCLRLQTTQSTLSQVKACRVLHRQSLVLLLIPDYLQQFYNWTSLCRRTDKYFQVHCLISWITGYTTCRWAMLSCTVTDQVTYALPQHKYVICWIESNASIFIKLKSLLQWMLYFHVQCQNFRWMVCLHYYQKHLYHITETEV